MRQFFSLKLFFLSFKTIFILDFFYFVNIDNLTFLGISINFYLTDLHYCCCLAWRPTKLWAKDQSPPLQLEGPHNRPYLHVIFKYESDWAQSVNISVSCLWIDTPHDYVYSLWKFHFSMVWPRFEVNFLVA